jgi:diguanylate cyclase (GGDEF)-like protein
MSLDLLIICSIRLRQGLTMFLKLSRAWLRYVLCKLRPERRNMIALVAMIGTLFASLFLALFVVLVLETMRDKADEIDDTRAKSAANTAVVNMHRRLEGTIEDNSIWREAYEAITNGNRYEWIHDNWGVVSADYDLYDGVIVANADGTPFAAYLKGQLFDPSDLLRDGLKQQIVEASKPDQPVENGIYPLGSNFAIVSSHAVQEQRNLPPGERRPVLTMIRMLTPEMIKWIATNYSLPGLQLTVAEPKSGNLGVALVDRSGEAIAYLTWPAHHLGGELYEEVKLKLQIAFVFLGFLFLSGVIAGYFEVRALRRLAAAADREAQYDSLSGLLNRNGMIRSLEATVGSLSSYDNYTFLLADLDGFKEVNDTWGHLAGDQLIGVVGKRLSQCHPELSFVARFGGDEFALAVGPDVDPLAVADRVLDAISEPFSIAGQTLKIGASIGYAYREPGMSVLEMIRRADVALYRAKENGRGRSLAYSRELDEDREALAELETQLREALNGDDLAVVFQPVVSAETGKLTGVEALARWRRPQGPVSPEVFIAVAEKSGLINQLGAQVLVKAIRFAEERPGVEISVNVSPTQLCAPNFADDIAGLLTRQGFDARRLILEVTEGVLFSNPREAGRAIDALRAIGVRFALDDFGAGYASIGTLRHFHFDRLKLDRSLLWQMNEKTGRSVLKATLLLANALDIPVVIEGVETSDQASYVSKLGCHYLQGYLFGKPMADQEFDLAYVRTAKSV